VTDGSLIESISAWVKGEIAVISPVGGVVLVEGPGMKKRVDQRATLPRYQMSLMKLVNQSTCIILRISDLYSEPFPESMISLVSPFAGIHNLDLSPESLSADGAHQIWGQLTPHDDSSYDSIPLPYGGAPSIRAYQSEVEMYCMYQTPKCDRGLTEYSVPMLTIFTSIHTCHCCPLR
jgi:hypothetical protein